MVLLGFGQRRRGGERSFREGRDEAEREIERGDYVGDYGLERREEIQVCVVLRSDSILQSSSHVFDGRDCGVFVPLRFCVHCLRLVYKASKIEINGERLA